MTPIISLDTLQRWDFAGIDGLAAAKAWFGSAVDQIAPFQSLETEWQGQSCSVLRLCEGNFRCSFIASQPPILVAGQRVWLKQLDWLTAIALPETALDRLLGLVIPKPPYRLQGPELNCAIPARLQGTALLIWRHWVAGQPGLEIHLAKADLVKVLAVLAGS